MSPASIVSSSSQTWELECAQHIFCKFFATVKALRASEARCISYQVLIVLPQAQIFTAFRQKLHAHILYSLLTVSVELCSKTQLFPLGKILNVKGEKKLFFFSYLFFYLHGLNLFVFFPQISPATDCPNTPTIMLARCSFFSGPEIVFSESSVRTVECKIHLQTQLLPSELIHIFTNKVNYLLCMLHATFFHCVIRKT